MERNRLEAFSDGVVSILIAIMVLELKVPHSAELSALKPLLPVRLGCELSFISFGFCVYVALVRLVPNRRIKRVLAKSHE